MIKIKINGRELEAQAGATVLETAKSHGIYIPNLCSAKQLAPYGGCRLCLIEIKGRRGYPPACCTSVEDGLDVQTETAELQTLRRRTLELILSEHPHACLICTEKKNCEDYKSTIRKVGEVTGCALCSSNGDCRLQEAVEHIRPERVPYPAVYRQIEVHREDPFFDRNYNLCILCGSCVRVCEEIRGASVISFVSRGPRSVIETAFDRPLLDSGCQFCGACVDVCPTGALTERAVKGHGLPSEKREALCPLCGVGCAMEAGISRDRVLSFGPKEEETPNNGQACVRGRFVLRDVVHSPKRLLQPMIRRDGELVPTGWDEALDRVAAALGSNKGERVTLVSSPQMSLEDQYIFLKFARDFWHTKPLRDVDDSSALAAYWGELHAAGIEPALNFELSSIAGAKAILAVDTNLKLSQPILWLEVVKAVRGGAALISLNPREAGIERFASWVLRLSPEGEEQFLNSMAGLEATQGATDDKGATLVGGEFAQPDAPADPSFLEAPDAVGGPAAVSAARLLVETQPSVILFGSGLAGRRDAARLIRILWNLSLQSGARLIPLADDCNERGSLELRRWLGGGSPRGERALTPGKILYLAGEAPPMSEKPAEFFLYQGCHANSCLEFADVVLPAASFAETDGTYVNLEGRIQRSRRVVPPAGEAKPDWWIFSQLARRMGSADYTYEDASSIAAELAGAVPALAEVAHHHRKGKPAFVAEFPDQVRQCLAVTEEGSVAEPSAVPPRGTDIYRGLDLTDEIKGLKKLRLRSRNRHA